MIKPIPSCDDINESGLISVSDALQAIYQQLTPIQGFQRIPIGQAKGRILAEALNSPLDVPAHTNSAVDGYAFRNQDQQQNQPTRLEIAGTAFAGKPFQGEITEQQCLRIMTGAAVPDHLDTVIMQEQVQHTNELIEFDLLLKPGQNIRYAGEDIQSGATVLCEGKRLTAADIGLAASLGVAEINVVRPLTIAIASTGDELKDPGSANSPGDIFDSNRYSLIAALDRPDIEMVDLGILQDDPEIIVETLRQAAVYADLIISSGGVSVGEADYTKAALQQAGQIDFWKVAIKPGRPLAFGKLCDKPFFGLPGNPVAVWVTYYQFVLPAIEKLLNLHGQAIAPRIQAVSLQRLRKKPGRTEIQRGILEQSVQGEWTVRPTGKQGSGRLSSMSIANAFILLDENNSGVEIGDTVTVQPFGGLF